MEGPWTKFQPSRATPQEGPWSRFQAQPAPELSGAGPEQIGTFGEDGRILRLPDGTLNAVSPAASITDQEAVRRIMAGESYQEVAQSQQDQRTIAANPIATRGAQALSGVMFGGEWVDNLADRVSPGTGQNIRNAREAYQREAPKSATAYQIGGGLASAVPMAFAAAPSVIARGGTLAGNAIRATIAGALAGSADGASQGAGAADDGDRAQGAIRGGLIGGGLGAIGGALAPIAGAAAKALTQRVRGLDVKVIMDEFGLDRRTARVVRTALANDDLELASRTLREIGDDAMLADAGPATQNLLDSASQTGGAALTRTRRAVEGRANAAGQRLKAALDDIMGTPQGQREGARSIAERTAGARRSAYTQAYAQPIDYAADTGRALEGVLGRVPPRVMQQAVQEANEAMQESGARNLQIMAEIADDGTVTFSQPLNVQQVDEIKKALGGIARAGVDEFGRATGEGLRAGRLSSDLRDALTEAVPEYGRAVRLGGDKIAEDNAYRVGTNLLTNRTTIEDVQDVLRGSGREGRLAAMSGLRSSIEQTMSQVRRTITDPNVDAREAMQLIKDMSSRANRQKVQAVLGPSRTDRLYAELRRSEAALGLRAAVSRNSATAIRQSTQDEIRDQVAPGITRRTLGRMGNPLDSAQEITQTLMGIDPRSLSTSQKSMLDDIARVLTETRGDDARRALIAVRRAMSGQPIRDVEAELIGRAVGSTVGPAAYQSGGQLLGHRAN